jgi:large subunit ribosomal protein L21
VVADTKALGKASVTVEVIGDSKGPKIDIFKYKNKTGYRRHHGHRQKYSRIKVTAISAGSLKKKAKAESSEAAKEA